MMMNEKQPSVLSIAIAAARDDVRATLSPLSASGRRRQIKKMLAEVDAQSEATRQSLRDRGITDEAAWQRELAAVEAPYFAAMELFSADCPQTREE